jgi:hypothetical protein
MDFADRDALVEEDPGTYYLKEHYLNYPCVLVRLSRVRADALRDLITGAHRFVGAKVPRSRSEVATVELLGGQINDPCAVRRSNPARSADPPV